MKARLSFKYHVLVGEDFDYIERKFYKTYDRSGFMTVTADTEKECNDLLDNFKDYIYKETGYCMWDSSLDADLDKKTNKWIGEAEILVDDRAEFEDFKEVYKEWKSIKL